MSISFDSWESIFSWVGRRYDERSPSAFDREYHLKFILDTLSVCLGKKYLKFVTTFVYLKEPLLYFKREKIIILSIPLIVEYINYPVSFKHKIEDVSNFDILSAIDESFEYTSKIQNKNIINYFRNAKNRSFELNSDNRIAFIILCRIVVMVRHLIHHINIIDSGDDSHNELNFPNIEFAE